MNIIKPSLILSPLLALSLNACLFSQDDKDENLNDSNIQVEGDSLAVIDSITGDTTYIKQSPSDSVVIDSSDADKKGDSTKINNELNFRNLFKQGFYDISIYHYSNSSESENPEISAKLNQSESETPLINAQRFEFNWELRNWDDTSDEISLDDNLERHVYHLNSQGWKKSKNIFLESAAFNAQGNIITPLDELTININEAVDLTGKGIVEISDDLEIFEDFQFSKGALTYDLGYVFTPKITVNSSYQCEKEVQLDEEPSYLMCIGEFSPISERLGEGSYKTPSSWEEVIAYSQENNLDLAKVDAKVKLFEDGKAQFEGYNEDGKNIIEGTWVKKRIHGSELYIMNQPSSSKDESEKMYTSFIVKMDGYFYTGSMIEEETRTEKKSILFNKIAFEQLSEYLKAFDLSKLNPEQIEKLKRFLKPSTQKGNSWF